MTEGSLTVKPLGSNTWDTFTRLVKAHGVWDSSSKETLCWWTN